MAGPAPAQQDDDPFAKYVQAAPATSGAGNSDSDDPFAKYTNQSGPTASYSPQPPPASTASRTAYNPADITTWPAQDLSVPGPGAYKGQTLQARQAETARRNRIADAGELQDLTRRIDRSTGEKIWDTAVGAGSMGMSALGFDGGLSGSLQRWNMPQMAQSAAKSESDFAKDQGVQPGDNSLIGQFAPLNVINQTLPVLGGLDPALAELGSAHIDPALTQLRASGVPVPQSIVPQPNKQVTSLAQERADRAQQDWATNDKFGISQFSPGYTGYGLDTMANAVGNVPGIGMPVKGSLESAVGGTRDAIRGVADDIGRGTTYDEVGNTLQRGLDRAASSSLQDLPASDVRKIDVRTGEVPVTDANGNPLPSTYTTEPMNPFSPVQQSDNMSAAAAKRAQQREQIAPIDDATAQTSRGVEVPVARTYKQTLAARRGIEDLSPSELQAVIDAPVQNTSFATRRDALYEQARQALPQRFKTNGDSNPPMTVATNARDTWNKFVDDQNSTGIKQGIQNSAFSGIGQRLQTQVPLDTLYKMRTEVGRALGPVSPYETGMVPSQLRQLYGSLSQDIQNGVLDLANKAHIQSQLAPTEKNYVAPEMAQRADQALYSLRRADIYNRKGMNSVEKVQSLLNADTPEQAVQKLMSAAAPRGDKPGDINLVRTVKSMMRPEDFNDFAGLLLREMGAPLPSAQGMTKELGYSVTRAATKWDQIDPRVRTMMFGDRTKDISDLMQANQRLAHFESMSNFPKTAGHLAALGLFGSVLRSLATNDWVGLANTILWPLGASAAMSSKMYGRAAVGLSSAWGTFLTRLNTAGSAVTAAQSPSIMNGLVGSLARVAQQVDTLAGYAKRNPALAPMVYKAQAELQAAQQRLDEMKRLGQQQRLPAPAQGAFRQ